MMKTIRNAAKPVYIVVIIAFVGTIIFAWGMDIGSKSKRPPNAIGRINDQDIPIELFSRTYESKYQELIKTNTDPGEEDLQKLRDDTWNTIIGQTLLAQAITKNNIQLTNEELAEYVKVLPPNELYESPDMQTDGKFDPQKYQNLLQRLVSSDNPRDEQVLLYIESSIKSQVLMNKLQGLITSTAFISKAEVRDQYIDLNEKVKVKYVFISEGDVDTAGIEITDEMLLARYEQDKETSYKQDETASLKYVSFDKKPSEADIDSVRKDIFEIYNQIKAGADFAELAEENSQDRGGENGGDLGFFSKNRMVKPFEDAAFALEKIGDVSEPVQTQFGWHIIKLTGKKTEKNDKGVEEPQIQASHILLKTEASEKTMADLRDQAERFRQEAVGNGFDQAAEEAELTPQTTKPFAPNANIPNIGPNKELSNMAFKAKLGSISDVVDSRNAYIVAAVNSREPAGFEPFEEVKDRIKNIVRRDLLNEKTYAKGNELYQQMIDGKLSFAVMAGQANLTVKETDFFSRNEFVKNVGSDPAFIGAAFSLSPENPLSAPIEGRTGCYLLEFVQKQPVDFAKYDEVSDSLYQDAVTKKRQDAWSKWYRKLYEDSKIEDFRQDIYGS